MQAGVRHNQGYSPRAAAVARASGAERARDKRKETSGTSNKISPVCNSLYKQVYSSIQLPARAPASTNRRECRGHSTREGGTRKCSLLCAVPAPWISWAITVSWGDQSPATNWLTSRLELCYVPLLSGSNFTGITLVLSTKFWFQYIRK